MIRARSRTRWSTSGVCCHAFVLLAGLMAGHGTAALVFYYDGTQPINVLPVLSAFVLLPLVLLVCLGMRAMLGKLIPLLLGRPGLQPSLSLWCAALMALLQRCLPQRYREAMQLTLGWSRAHYRLYGRVHRWSLLTWSQVFALGFMCSAIAWFVFRLSTTDGVCVEHNAGYRAADDGGDHQQPGTAVTHLAPRRRSTLATPSETHGISARIIVWYPRGACRGTRALVAVCPRRHDYVRRGATSARTAAAVPVAAARGPALVSGAHAWGCRGA